MNKKTIFLTILFFGIILLPKEICAQKATEESTDDLGDVTDAFQESFFEALKQKGIENYELALNALTKAETATKDDAENTAAVYFEMGKNFFFLKKYDEAAINFKKVLAWDSEKIDAKEALYDVYFKQKDYESAIPLAIALIEYDIEYKEDLANLYSRTQQYTKALTLLDEIDQERGESNYRNVLRTQIYKITGNSTKIINTLEEKIDKNPKDEKEYLRLIFLYSEEGDSKKAFETAKELLKQKPNSQLVHLALYKYYLGKGVYNEAINSMKIVFNSEEIKIKTKNKVLEDYLIFIASNPSYLNDITITINLPKDANGQTFKILGDFYLAQDNPEEALHYFKKGLENDKDNFNLLKSVLLLQVENKKYIEAEKLSSEGLEIFPAQPLLYLINGVVNNELKKTDIAIEGLETGLDYIFDNPKMEYDFYQQLVIAYTDKGNNKQAKVYAKKASEVIISNKQNNN